MNHLDLNPGLMEDFDPSVTMQLLVTVGILSRVPLEDDATKTSGLVSNEAKDSYPIYWVWPPPRIPVANEGFFRDPLLKM